MARNEVEKSRSIGRNSKFALNADHERLKRMIAKREKTLEELLEQSKDQLNFFNEKQISRHDDARLEDEESYSPRDMDIQK